MIGLVDNYVFLLLPTGRDGHSKYVGLMNSFHDVLCVNFTSLEFIGERECWSWQKVS